MSIDKSIRQYYDVPGTKEIKDQLHKLAYITDKEAKILKRMGGIETRTPEGIPAYPGHHGSSGSSMGVGQGGGHRGGGDPPDRQDRARHQDPPAPQTPNRVSPQQSMAMTGNTSLAGQTQSQAQASVDSANASRDLGTSLHGGPTVKEAVDLGEKKKKEREYFENLEKEKMDFIGGQWVGGTKIAPKTTREKVAEFEDTPEQLWTIEQKRLMEKLESEQDWDKVQDLADKGHSSDDIQKAMDKGLLMKQSEIQKQGLIERGLAAIMPKTKLESSLLSKLKKSIDPKSIAGGMLKSAAMKKLGLGWLNPILGLASLFGFDPIKKAQEKFAKKPTDMSAFNKLGLYDAGISTTDTAKRVGEKTIGSDIVAGRKGVFESGQELLGLKDIEGQQAKARRLMTQPIDVANPLARTPIPLGTVDPYQQSYAFPDKLWTDPRSVSKSGGRIDKPLTGRSRDI